MTKWQQQGLDTAAHERAVPIHERVQPAGWEKVEILDRRSAASWVIVEPATSPKQIKDTLEGRAGWAVSLSRELKKPVSTFLGEYWGGDRSRAILAVVALQRRNEE